MQETRETQVLPLGQKDPLVKEMATRGSILAWKIPWTEDPGQLQSMAQLSTHTHSTYIQWNITQLFKKKKSNEILPFSEMWMDPETDIQGEVKSEREK